MTNNVFCIVGDYHFGTEIDGTYYMYDKKCFLGLKGENRLFIYEETPTERTLMFDTEKEAMEYIENHRPIREGSMSCGNHRVEGIITY